MTHLKELWTKLRYSHFLRIFFDALAKLGIRISPFYLFQEIIPAGDPPPTQTGFEEYEMSFWGLEEIKQMAEIPGRKFSEEFLLQRLTNGHKCLGLKKNNQLVAFSWCNFKEAASKYYQFPLKEDEAYIFDAYTLMPFRGKGIAPFLRYHLYLELKKHGRTKLYSFSDYFNTSAVRFKYKLNAKKEKLYLTIDLFNKWRFNFTFKDYQK